jgi:hypothetical protein
MTEAAILSGDFSSFKHIKTRKVFVIEVEFPEEMGRQVLEVLGMPIGGESKPVAVALLDKSVISKKEATELTEGDKLRTRAVLLCKEEKFQSFIISNYLPEGSYSSLDNANYAKMTILDLCGINSRSELATNLDAQDAFNALLRQFNEWKVSQQYADNLNR